MRIIQGQDWDYDGVRVGVRGLPDRATVMPPALTMVSFTDGSSDGDGDDVDVDREGALLLVGVVAGAVCCADKSSEAFMRMARQLDRWSVWPVNTPNNTCTGVRH